MARKVAPHTHEFAQRCAGSRKVGRDDDVFPCTPDSSEEVYFRAGAIDAFNRCPRRACCAVSVLCCQTASSRPYTTLVRS